MARLTAFLMDINLLHSDKRNLIERILTKHKNELSLSGYKTDQNEHFYVTEMTNIADGVEVRTFGRNPIRVMKHHAANYVFAVPAEWVIDQRSTDRNTVANVLMSSEGIQPLETRHISNVGFCLSNITVMYSKKR